ncbi:MAG: DUF2779 domain-containing protein [Alphaproteobacteria bacterium]|nr:DUF2779 domain-containing protein [Alphaproteobacteria bacterium]
MTSQSTEPAKITKSRYVAGLQCDRRLWMQVFDPLPAEQRDSTLLQEAGTRIGVLAQRLFDGGVLVKEKPWQHGDAVDRTKTLMADPNVGAIFEAAFEAEGVRIRVDVLERLPDGPWGLREVKSSGGVKEQHRDDLAVQAFVLGAAGVRLGSVELVHINTIYVRGEDGLDLKKLFVRADMTKEIDSLRSQVATRLTDQQAVLRRHEAPLVEPSPHCDAPYGCEFWDRCTVGKPKDWIYFLPRLSARKFAELRAMGIERIAAIPDDFALSTDQKQIRDVVRSGASFVSNALANALRAAGPPTVYLDFETVAPAIPLWPGTRPYQPIPFQWSAHIAQDTGHVSHREFLAGGRGDPRREFAESLIEAVGGNDAPIFVYSSFEDRQLAELQSILPTALADAIGQIRGRLFDLLPVIQKHVYHPNFAFSRSIKSVAPALAPHITYEDLPLVADGAAASAAFECIASGPLQGSEEAALRNGLLRYCERDTLAMVEVHRALLALIVG